MQTVADPYLALREATGQWQLAPASVTQSIETAKAYVRRTCDPNAGKVSAGNGSIAGSIYTWMNTTTSYWLEKTLHPENVGDMLYSGINYLTYGFVDGIIQQYEQRAQEMQNDPSLYNVTNWALSGIPDRIKGTIAPEEPLSLQHWLDSLSVVMMGYSLYRGYQISQEPANTIYTPHPATGGKQPSSNAQVTNKNSEFVSESSEKLSELIPQANRIGSALKNDIYHRSASYVSSEQLSQGTVFNIVGRDGNPYILLQVEGGVNGKYGVFEYIINSSGEIPHQLFKEGGMISGIPN